MKALSIRQPWAWLIVRPDLVDPEARAVALSAGLIKDIENRTWETNFRGRFLVHAAKGMTQAEYRVAAEFAGACGVEVPSFNELQRGGIVGAVDLLNCRSDSRSTWYMGLVAFELANARPLPFKPLKGRLKFFDTPYSETDLMEIETP